MTDLIVILLLTAVLGLAAFYLYRAKKQGQKCIGCPHAKKCASSKGGCTRCTPLQNG
jgi:hypothetical protein